MDVTVPVRVRVPMRLYMFCFVRVRVFVDWFDLVRVGLVSLSQGVFCGLLVPETFGAKEAKWRSLMKYIFVRVCFCCIININNVGYFDSMITRPGQLVIAAVATSVGKT